MKAWKKPFNATNASKDATEDSAKALFDKELETKLAGSRQYLPTTKDGNVDLPADVVKEAYAKSLGENSTLQEARPHQINAGEYLEEMTTRSTVPMRITYNHEEKLKKFFAGEVPIDPDWRSARANHAHQG